MIADISFVFQGPVVDAEAAEYLQRSIAILRAQCPSSEIVVASWRGQCGDRLTDVDRLVLLEDPGMLVTTTVWWNRFKFRNANTKRMLHSTREGLRAATRKYCVKLRTDSRVDAEKLLACLQADLQSGLASSLFEQRVWVGDLFSRNPRRSALLFHLSDIFLVGLRADLLGIFDKAWEWVQTLERSGGAIPWLCPEQFLWLPTLRGDASVGLAHGFAFSPDKALRYESAVLENIHILEAAGIGLTFSKQFGTTHEDCYRRSEIAEYAASKRRSPNFYAAALVSESWFRNMLSRVLLLNLGVKSRVLRLFKRGSQD